MGFWEGFWERFKQTKNNMRLFNLLFFVFVIVAIIILGSASNEIYHGRPVKIFGYEKTTPSNQADIQFKNAIPIDTTPKKVTKPNINESIKSVKQGNTFINNAPNSGFQSAGDMTVNITTKKERSPSPKLIQEILDNNKSNLGYYLEYDMSDSEQNQYAHRIKDTLKHLGFIVYGCDPAIRQSRTLRDRSEIRMNPDVVNNTNVFRIEIYPMK